MSETNNQIADETEISISAIISLGFKYIKAVIIAFFVGIILLGGYKSFSAYRAAQALNEENEDSGNKAESYEEKMIQWELDKEIQKKNLAATQKKRDFQLLYNDTAPGMMFDADAVVKTVVTFSVASDETFTLIGSSGDRDMPVAYIVAQKYIDDWKSVDIVSLLDNGVTEDAWLREVIFLSTSEAKLVVSGSNLTYTTVGVSYTSYTSSCPLVLTVYSATPEEGNDICEKISSFLLSMQDRVTFESFAHTIEIVDTKQSVNKETAISQYQIQNIQNANKYTESIKTVKEDIKKVEADSPDSPLKEIIKWAIIGAIAGAFCACLCLLVSFISKSPVTSSFEFADRTGFTYLGGVFKKRKWNEKTSDRLLNERTFLSADDASSFITENAKTVAEKGTKVLVASTFYTDEAASSDEVASVIESLKNAGLEVSFAGNAVVSTSFIKQLGETDKVIILEKRWESRWQNISTELETVSRLGKTVAGFILV